MGLRFTTRLFLPPLRKDVRAATLAAAQKIGAYAKESKDKEKLNLLLIGEHQGVLTMEFPYHDGDFIFFRQLSIELGALWIEARIQEGTHWDYTLHYPGYPLDTFSTLPEYWDPDDELAILARKGRPDLLAKAWKIPQHSIDRYIRQWGRRKIDDDTHKTILKGKAYSDDKSGYGECEQLFDLLRKLHYTTKMKWFFELRIPKRNYSPKRDFVEDLWKG